MFLSRTPEPSTQPPTEAQIGVRNRFKLAHIYATAAAEDPAQVALYQPIALAQGKTVFAVAMADFLRPPSIAGLDLSGYAGEPGGKLIVLATDDAAVVSVQIEIRALDDTVLEQGPATPLGGGWTYTPTSALASGQEVTIVATAKDRPGNATVKPFPYRTP
jgi:hypothetical protein